MGGGGGGGESLEVSSVHCTYVGGGTLVFGVKREHFNHLATTRPTVQEGKVMKSNFNNELLPSLTTLGYEIISK